MPKVLMFTLFFLAPLSALAQHTPTIFDVSDVVAGAQRVPCWQSVESDGKPAFLIESISQNPAVSQDKIQLSEHVCTLLGQTSPSSVRNISSCV
jgi:hypothetical protein